MDNSLSLEKYTKLLIKDWKIIVYFMAGMLVLTIIYGLLLYKPNYQSKFKVIVKNNPQVSFVTDLNSENAMPLSATDNPVLSQIEILSSDDLIEAVANKLQSNPDYKQYAKDDLELAIKHSIKVKNPPGTDIINISFKWNTPDEAQKLAQFYVNSYIDFNAARNRRSITQMKTYIKDQLAKSSGELAKIRSQISAYRKNNQSVDIEHEASTIVDQITTIENSIADVDGKLKSAMGTDSALSGKLGFSISKAIESVALGQNTNLITLQQNLHDAQQKYAALNAKYPPSNVQMRALNDNINEIKREIAALTTSTLGKKLANIDHSIIADSVRMKMVSDLVDSQSSVQALNMQKESLKSTLSNLKGKQSYIPEKQRNLESLLQDETTLAQVVQTLSAKLVEAQIKESEIESGIDIVDKPSLPDQESFPTLLHIFLIFEFIGILLGIATIIGLYYVEDICQGINELEEIIKAPVFGIIPWLSDLSYKTSSTTDFNPASGISIAYQKITTCLKIKSFKNKTKVIAFSSAEFEKKRSIISVNVAKNLAKSKNSTIIIDLDLRDGGISKEFNINKVYKEDIVHLLIETCACISKNEDMRIERLINNAISPVSGQPNLYILPNTTNIDNPNELLDNDALEIIISKLKRKFDFIIIDTPPMLAVPDCISISRNFDGLVLLCGIKTSRSNLRRIRKICDDNYIQLFGAVARNPVAEHNIPENQYIKQLGRDIDESNIDIDIDIDDSQPESL